MTDEPFLFTADRRGIQGTTFHFSERPSGDSSGRGFSQQDNLSWSLDKIYQSKFTFVNPQLRSILVAILVAEVPLTHRNLTLLATANWIVYYTRYVDRLPEITPERFATYFDYVAPLLMSDVTGKTPQQSQDIRTKFKVTLLRYIFYIQQQTSRPTPQ